MRCNKPRLITAQNHQGSLLNTKRGNGGVCARCARHDAASSAVSLAPVHSLAHTDQRWHCPPARPQSQVEYK